ncbi:cytochrome c family protein [Primorskyibacter aestuariivivens]|uniref:c-type cytochrome n=1 Tax=Primorskyibacter aestuariivivens TaxID=1888912 RepID=UPI0023004F6C|nr:cytochrome c family protein [Primorskyibacter aestuariivivens]MDA7427225.1 cytochrome c family protein [Primorskyibacter aestuariivivens]
MDTMTSTKILGAFCGAFLIFLLGKWAAEVIYSTGGGHGGEEQAYVIETGDDGAEEEATEGPSLEELIASADLGKGEKVFGKCRACHKVEDGANGTGPHLYGVVGRATGAVDGFGYSGAMAAVTPEWNVAALDAFLENPKGYAPGTKMSFAGLKKAEDRANLIAWLDSLDN